MKKVLSFSVRINENIKMCNTGFLNCQRRYPKSPTRIRANTPQALLEQGKRKRRYTKTRHLSQLAENLYRDAGKGLTFFELIKQGVVDHKTQAQLLLKRALKANVLFTLQKRRPQIYYPMSQKSAIMKKYLTKNMPKEVTGVNQNTGVLVTERDSIVMQSLIDYVLPMMHTAPLSIHKLQLKTKLTQDCYLELPFNSHRANKAKECGESIGNNHATYLFYPNGTVMVAIENSNNPLMLETEYDRSNILAFLGQVRDRLILILSDSHERFVPKILEWDLTQCDINKDICVSHLLQFSAINVQVKHLDHLFRLYIRSMGKDTVFRVEESKILKKGTSVEESINQIFNPNEVTNELLRQQIQELLQIKSELKRLTDMRAYIN